MSQAEMVIKIVCGKDFIPPAKGKALVSRRDEGDEGF
jgi:hypothetical protein